MKAYLLLGLLLLASFSFARIEPNWMMYSADNYGCNYYYHGKGWDDGTIGLGDIANEYYTQCERPGCWDIEELASYLEDMSWAVWDEGETGMCEYSGCRSRPSTANFRSSMLAFNAAAFGFNSEFNAGVRRYIAAGGSRAGILEDIADAKADHRDCLEFVREEGPCEMCPDVS